MQNVRKASVLLLLFASLCIGISQISLLPPWEGFDETAHYSYVAQLAKSGVWPRAGDPLSAEVERYRKVAPMPYASVKPYDENGGWTYHTFFAASADVVRQGGAAISAPREDERPWQAGTQTNWEAQHPPLFYAILSPAFELTEAKPLSQQLLVLRTLSFLFAWGSLCLVVANASRIANALGGSADLPWYIALAAALWPFLFPGWFPEMVRLGNDGLVAVDAALIWLAFLASGSTPSVRNGVAIGIASGVGLLVKATILPVFIGVAGFLLFLLSKDRHHRDFFKARFVHLLIVLATTLSIAGWWYIGKLLEAGNIIGSNELLAASNAGGVAAFFSRPSALWVFIKGWLLITTSFFWSSTWSFVSLSTNALWPFFFGTILLVHQHWQWLSKQTKHQAWLPVTVLLLFLSGFATHLIYIIAATGGGGTPGWYLHSAAPILVAITATAMASIGTWRWGHATIAGWVLYGAGYLLSAGFVEAIVFTGCGTKGHKVNRYEYDVASGCMSDFLVTMERLSLLAHPHLALFFASLGFLALLCGVGFFLLAGRPMRELPVANPMLAPVNLPTPTRGSKRL